MSPLAALVLVGLACCCTLLELTWLPTLAVQAEQNRYSHLQPNESADYQAVNTYLTEALKLGPAALVEPEVVVQHLKAAIELIETFGAEEFSWMQPNEELFEAKFNALANNDAKLELKILNSLLDATNGICDNERLDFLLFLVEKQTFELQTMNILAQKLLDKCLDINTKSLGAKIERSIGKISSPMFDFITNLAERTATRLEDAKRGRNFAQRDRGVIKIHDGEQSIDVSDDKKRAQLLKGVKFDNLREFALIINELFSKTLPDDERYKPGVLSGPTRKQEVEKLESFFKELLIEPCKDVMQRVKEAYSPLLDYNRKRPARTMSSILDSERTSNPTLDYHLEVHRICRQSCMSRDRIWKLLESMR